MSQSVNTFQSQAAVISSMISNGMNADAKQVLAKLEPQMFSPGITRDCFCAIHELFNMGDVIDILTVSDHIAEYQSLADVGMLVKDNTIPASNIKGHAKRVRQGWLLKVAEKETQAALDSIKKCQNVKDIGKTAEAVQKALANVVVETDKKKPRHIKAVLRDYIDVLDARFNGKEAGRMVMTGIEDLDAATGGIFPDDFIVVGGAPSMGKTEFVCTLLNSAVGSGEAGFMFSMEMSDQKIAGRMIGIETGFSSTLLKNPIDMQDDDWAKLAAASAVISEKNIYVLDESSLCLEDIEAYCKEFANQHPLAKMIVIDQMSFIDLPDADRMTIAIGIVARGLKRIAKELQIPIVLLTQLDIKTLEKRSIDNRRPTQGDIKESVSLAEFADWIFFPYRHCHYVESAPKIAEIVMGKAREGGKRTIFTGWVNGHFTKIDQQEAMRAMSEFEDRSGGRQYVGNF